MFWKKKEVSEEKLSRPREIPAVVQKHLVDGKKMSPKLATLLKAVIRKDGESSGIRIFDESDALANKVEVKSYASLDGHEALVLFEGTYNEVSKQVNLEQKKNVTFDTPIYSEAEIRQKVESLKEPGSSIFFYMAAGSAHGGPLGMGAAVIELNPAYPGKKQKRYNCYTVDVVDGRPVSKGEMLFGSDKAKDIASWIKNAHRTREYSS